jgi:hypothetical protein
VELEEGLGLEEELGDDEVCPGLHLLLQVPQVLLVVRAVRVPVRVAWIDRDTSRS